MQTDEGTEKEAIVDGQPAATQPDEKREGGFTMIVALLVMGLLTVLGLTLMFTSQTERTISRNFSGTMQATYAGEAMVDSAVQALLFDLQHDAIANNQPGEKAGGWADPWLVVSELPDETATKNKYKFDPTNVRCNTADPANPCLIKDDGSRTGASGQWVVDLRWRPSGKPRPVFPSTVPMRIYHDTVNPAATRTDLSNVLVWWTQFDAKPGDDTHLNTGQGDIAMAALCVGNCTDADPTKSVYDPYQVYVTGIGSSTQKIMGSVTRKGLPATRAVSIRVRGNLLSLWENALVGGGGGSSSNPVIQGDYLIRGSVLMFGDGNPSRTVLKFGADKTGIVNNYYDTFTGVPTIDGFWWRDAHGCNVEQCDAHNTKGGFGRDSDGDATTETIEALSHHLPDPSDHGSPNAAHPYRAASGSSTFPEYPGPEGLDATVRVKTGKIEVTASGASVGRAETTTDTPFPGLYWDNVTNIYTNASTSYSTNDVDPTSKVFLHVGVSYDQKGKTGPFDITTDALQFPSLITPYLEPVTREVYANYYEFLRPSPADRGTHPGGWGLDLSDIDGRGQPLLKYPTLGRDIHALKSNKAPDDDEKLNAVCWPRGWLDTPGGDKVPAAPSLAEVHNAFNNGTGLKLRGPTCAAYTVDDTNTTCGNDTKNDPNAVGDCWKGANDTNARCTISLTCGATVPGPPGSICDSTACPKRIDIHLPKRYTNTPGKMNELNFDTSSSLDAPAGRAQNTMYNSFAYRLYIDLLQAMANCDTTKSQIYSNNFPTDFPALFKKNIPSSYLGTGDLDCSPQIGPCFKERSAYMDVHVQLPDLPGETNPPYCTPGTCGFQYYPGGRWLSVRFRPSGAADGQMTVLSDPRATLGACDTATTTVGPQTDIPDEVVEVESPGPPNYRYRTYLVDPNNPAKGPATWWKELHIPRDYDRAFAADASDTQRRNMPTGAWVVALHLPCSDDVNDKNPYKCDTIKDKTSVSYPGFYTHIVGYAPKYTCWRTSRLTWSAGPSSNIAVPHKAPTYACTAWPDTTTSDDRYWQTNYAALGVCPTYDPSNTNQNISWFAESLYMANVTTLWNTPRIFKSGDNDTYTPSPPFNMPSQSPLLGFKLAIPDGGKDPLAIAEFPQCDQGLDRRYLGFGFTGCGSIPSRPRAAAQCGVDNDGIRCNGKICAGPPTGCPTCVDVGPNCTQPKHLGNSADPCTNEDDFVPGSNNNYGGCNEIFSPITTMRNQYLDPNYSPNSPVKPEYPFTRVNVAPFGVDALGKWAVNNCSSQICTGAYPNCVYRGVSPDILAGWDPSISRYGRAWPGWSSAAYIEGAGLILSRDPIRFGSPQRSCCFGTCPDNSTIKPAPQAAWYQGTWSPTCDKSTVVPCFNCDWGSPAPMYNVDKAGAGYAPYKRGFWSDPIVFDGRMILYSGTASTSASTQVFFHDHVLPRTKFGCSDFTSILSNGNTTVDMEMPYDATTKKMLLTGFVLTQGELQVTTPMTTPLDNSAVQHELAGAWVAGSANFGNYTNPVQIIGSPAVSRSQCDHVFLPGRDPIPQRTYLSFVEDETLP